MRDWSVDCCVMANFPVDGWMGLSISNFASREIPNLWVALKRHSSLVCCGMLMFFACSQRWCGSYDGNKISPDFIVGLIRHQPTLRFLELQIPDRSVPHSTSPYVWHFNFEAFRLVHLLGIKVVGTMHVTASRRAKCTDDIPKSRRYKQVALFFKVKFSCAFSTPLFGNGISYQAHHLPAVTEIGTWPKWPNRIANLHFTTTTHQSSMSAACGRAFTCAVLMTSGSHPFDVQVPRREGLKYLLHDLKV